MCGLFGAFWTAAQPDGNDLAKRAAALTVLALQMEIRGNQSWGVYAPGANGGTLEKGTGSIDRVSMVPYIRARSVIGHTRFATQGAITRDNAHPFRFGGIVGAHNGVIYNASSLDKQRGQRFAVDSMHLIHALHVGDSFADFDGYGTVVWFDAQRPRVLNVGRFNNGDFAAVRTEAGILFASTASAVNAAASAAGLKILQTYTTDERHRYEIDPNGVRLAERDLFTCGRTSTRSWQAGRSWASGFGETWRDQLDAWEDDQRALWSPPITRPAVSTTAPSTRLASVLFTDPDPDLEDELEEDRALIEQLALKHGVSRNGARRAYEPEFNPLDEEDELYLETGVIDTDLFYDVLDVIDFDAWERAGYNGDDVADYRAALAADEPYADDPTTDEAPALPASVFGSPLARRVRV